MFCPYCNHSDTCVLESRVMADVCGMRRRRECLKCHKRFTTLEKIVKIDLKVCKRDARVEDFDREKIKKGIRKACWKREVSDGQIEDMVTDIEMKLLNRKSTRVPSRIIGKMILNRLKKVDDVAYLRFASVYLDFEKADDFRRFLTSVKF